MKTNSLQKNRGKRPRIRHIRLVVLAFVFVMVATSLAYQVGIGTPSSFGIEGIAYICPLGALETVATGRNFGIHSFILLGIAIALTIVFGKAFCAWICPSKYIQLCFPKTKQSDNERYAERLSLLSSDHSCQNPRADAKRPPIKSTYIVLIGTLASSAIFGFPVFCLICPIGLAFASFIAAWHLFQFNELTIGLILFPAIVLAELVLFKKWCSRICPLGALLSLISKINKTYKPAISDSACLRKNGSDCSHCADICPERIDPHNTVIPDCTKCGECVDECPVGAISIKLVSWKAPGNKNEEKEVVPHE